jgi:putative tryptophan/tyrosine transport system substrate-binding protein
MKRREFIGLLSGAAATWPLAARAQQAQRMPRIGVLAALAEADPDMQARLDGFRHGLRALGWVEGRNIDYRYTDGREERFQPLAKELLALKPELIFAHATPAVAVLQRESRAANRVRQCF